MRSVDTATSLHRRPTWSLWPWFGVLVAICWSFLLLRHASAGHHGAASSFGDAVTMWALMTVAMMAPTAVPVLAALTDILHRGPRTRWWLFLAGYLTAWLGFAVPVASTQVAAHRVVDDLFHGSGARFAGGAVLLLAGAYQFSAMKQRCLTECTTPMTFFLRHWRDGRWGAVRMGLRHGVACIGCCWALMLLAFVAGLDSVWLMAACAALMALEKLPSLAQQLAPALGAALIAAGVVLLLFSSGGTHHSVGPNIFP